MKMPRKIQRQLETKIRHSIATTRLHLPEGSSNTDSHPKQEADKMDGHRAGSSK